MIIFKFVQTNLWQIYAIGRKFRLLAPTNFQLMAIFWVFYIYFTFNFSLDSWLKTLWLIVSWSDRSNWRRFLKRSSFQWALERVHEAAHLAYSFCVEARALLLDACGSCCCCYWRTALPLCKSCFVCLFFSAHTF